MVSTPVVTTIHGFSSPRILPVYKKYDSSSYYVSISHADRSPELTYAATIYHGIDTENFTFRQTPTNNHLVYFGRFHPDKGAKEAIEIARLTGRELLMAGVIQDSEYFETYVEPAIKAGEATYIGSVGPVKRNEVLGDAAALLHPISFDDRLVYR